MSSADEKSENDGSQIEIDEEQNDKHIEVDNRIFHHSYVENGKPGRCKALKIDGNQCKFGVCPSYEYCMRHSDNDHIPRCKFVYRKGKLCYHYCEVGDDDQFFDRCSAHVKTVTHKKCSNEFCNSYTQGFGEQDFCSVCNAHAERMKKKASKIKNNRDLRPRRYKRSNKRDVFEPPSANLMPE